MKDELVGVYAVQLLYETLPEIDGDVLLGELQKRRGKVDRLGDKDDFYLYAFADHLVEYPDGRLPAQIFLGRPDKDEHPLDLEVPLRQSWGWPQAREVVSTCHSSMLLSDMLARGLEYKTRLSLFHHALDSVLALAPSRAIHWVASQQVVDPLAYLEARHSSENLPLQFAINVRFYHIANSERGEMLMDTMGLGTLGLPDLQCHFFGLEPTEVARVLYNSAYYIFDNGDIIEDGHTIQGTKIDDKWHCRHEMALAPPERVVLDLNPGPAHAAGSRRQVQ